MCIKCKNREMMQDVIGQVFDTSDALIDAFMLIERMKGRGATLDPDDQKVYDKLSRFVKAGDDEAAAADAGQVPDGLREALQQAFPGATIIVGSPDEVEAMLDKIINRDKKTH